MPDIERKALRGAGRGLKLSDTEAGAFVATIATFNVVDKDRDVTIPGAFEEGAAVKVSAWGHNWGTLPVGMAILRADLATSTEKGAGRFLLGTPHGDAHYATVKELGDLVEWSYGYEAVDSEAGQFEGQDVRFLKKILVHEISPVMVGAGVGTGTDMVKAAKSAIGPHGGATDDGDWDGPGNVRRAPSARAALRAMHAWVDPDGDADAKQSYKFPHHLVSADGEVGAASIRGAVAGIAVLNGARGGADIPEADHEAVYRHLARHLRDADIEPPELRKSGYPADLVLAAIGGDMAAYAAAERAVAAKRGAVFSRANRDRITRAIAAFRTSADDLDELLRSATPEDDDGKAAADVVAAWVTATRRRAALASLADPGTISG